MTGDESHVTFDDTSGQAAATFNRRFAAEGGMSTMSEDDARQAFPAGPLGIVFSSSFPARFDEGAADGLDAAVRPPPVVAEDDDDVSLPTGGPATVMLTDEAAKQVA